MTSRDRLAVDLADKLIDLLRQPPSPDWHRASRELDDMVRQNPWLAPRMSMEARK